MLDNDEDIIKKIVLSFEVTVFVLMTYICLGKFLFFSCWWLQLLLGEKQWVLMCGLLYIRMAQPYIYKDIRALL